MTALPTKIAAQVRDFVPTDYLSHKDARRMDRFTQFACAAAQQAAEDSKLEINQDNADRVGVWIGTGIGGLETFEKQHNILLKKGPNGVSPFLIPMMICNMASGQVSIILGARGPNSCTVTACAAGTNSIGDAFRIIQNDEADIMITGGAEASITPIAVGGFCAMRASLIIALLVHKIMHLPSKMSTLIGVGSSICGGSAIAATAPVINANDEEVAQSISVIFFFNVLAAIMFPTLGVWLGFSSLSGEAFGVFAGTAINDTSSVTAAAATWDSMYNLGSATLDKAVTVKLTRTLAIIPITVALAFLSAKKKKNADGMKINIKSIFPFFIIYFVLASIFTTIATSFGVPSSMFTPFKELSKFFIILAMAAIGLNTNMVKLVKSGGKPIVLGFCCWLGIIASSLALQHLLAIW